MSDTPTPPEPDDLSVFAEQFAHFTGLDGQPVELTTTSFTVGCGCGQHWSGPDAMVEYSAHECPLAGIDIDPFELLANVMDPSGMRRAHAAEISDTIEQGHYNVQPVFPTDEDGVNWAYTIGLWPGLPGEILIRGFGQDCAQLVDFFAGHLRSGTFTLIEGVHVFDETDPTAKVRVVPWAGDRFDFGQAIGHHGTEDFPRWQVVLADNDGRFPGDPGCEVETYQMKGLPA